MPSVEISNLCRSAGSVNGTTGAGVSGGNDCTPARTGAGVYTLTLGNGGIDSTECAITVTPRGSASICVAVAQTSDTVKTVRCFTSSTGAAVDADFDYAIWEMPNRVTP